MYNSSGIWFKNYRNILYNKYRNIYIVYILKKYFFMVMQKKVNFRYTRFHEFDPIISSCHCRYSYCYSNYWNYISILDTNRSSHVHFVMGHINLFFMPKLFVLIDTITNWVRSVCYSLQKKQGNDSKITGWIGEKLAWMDSRLLHNELLYIPIALWKYYG